MLHIRQGERIYIVDTKWPGNGLVEVSVKHGTVGNPGVWNATVTEEEFKGLGAQLARNVHWLISEGWSVDYASARTPAGEPVSPLRVFCEIPNRIRIPEPSGVVTPALEASLEDNRVTVLREPHGMLMYAVRGSGGTGLFDSNCRVGHDRKLGAYSDYFPEIIQWLDCALPARSAIIGYLTYRREDGYDSREELSAFLRGGCVNAATDPRRMNIRFRIYDLAILTTTPMSEAADTQYISDMPWADRWAKLIELFGHVAYRPPSDTDPGLNSPIALADEMDLRIMEDQERLVHAAENMQFNPQDGITLRRLRAAANSLGWNGVRLIDSEYAPELSNTHTPRDWRCATLMSESVLHAWLELPDDETDRFNMIGYEVLIDEETPEILSVREMIDRDFADKQGRIYPDIADYASEPFVLSANVYLTDKRGVSRLYGRVDMNDLRTEPEELPSAARLGSPSRCDTVGEFLKNAVVLDLIQMDITRCSAPILG